MNILVISASNRPNSQSRKVSNRLVEKLHATQHTVDLIDLHETKLPLFDSSKDPAWEELEPIISKADGFIWVVPEWDGMAPPAIINFLGHAADSLAHKPVLLVGVSNGMNGAYPIAELKMVGGKNRHHVLVPEHLVLKNIETIFNSTEPDKENTSDVSMHERAVYALNILLSYAEHLKQIRGANLINLEKYPYGM